MNHSGNYQFSYAELDRMAAATEVLPPRLALSAGAPMAAAAGPQTHVVYACQATYSPGTGGLLNTGLLAQAPYSSMTCVPGVVNAR